MSELDPPVAVPPANKPERVILFDFLAGFAASGATMVAVVATRKDGNASWMVLAAGVAFFAAGWQRTGARGRPAFLIWPLVAIGGMLPILLLRLSHLAFTSTLLTAMLVFILCCMSGLGALAGWCERREKHTPSYIVSGLSFLFLWFLLRSVVPFLGMLAFQQRNDAIAPFTVTDLQTGEEISSDSWKGKVVVLDLWGTWCTPCLAELPEIAAIHRHYADDPGVLFVALNSGTNGDTAAAAKDFLARRNFGLQGAIDSGQGAGSANKSLHVTILPTLYVLDQAGRLRVVHSGYSASEHLAEALEKEVDALR